MNAILAAMSLLVFVGVALFRPDTGGPAVLLGAALALGVAFVLSRAESRGRAFLLNVFIVGLLLRLLLATALDVMGIQEFFGGDALTYDEQGYATLLVWQGELRYADVGVRLAAAHGWGMPYLVAAIYGLVGRNMLAVQFVNAVIGAATAPVIFLCARH
ncbi:MAG: hypothetical protein ACRD9R_15170, partial [Pyrinomonadaceae bacterium]